MRSALICVFFTLVVQRGGSTTVNAEHDEDFQPTPIPLSIWPRERLEAAGTLQEIIKSEAPPTTAAVPAHYWEDALRHSVYLTLVRDKIDQLIAQGVYISSARKPENQAAKEIDDHDLWDKIKTARFDRLKEQPIPPGDVTILAKGRLLEDEQGYRFLEDIATQNNCSDSNCAKGVKAFWSVKRMRQEETSTGKYHYELTFSVTSQTTKKLKKPYENPARTFTIKESIPPTERQIASPHGKTILHQDKGSYLPQRAIWVHKNINPILNYPRRPASSTRGLDRIFSSLFSDEDSYEDGYRHIPKPYYPNGYPQHAKVTQVDDRDPYFQKKLLPYPMAKPQPHRYTYPPPAPYVRQPYFNVDTVGNGPFVQPYSDNRYLPSNVIKTTRPAVLPTPFTNHPLLKESTIEVPVKTKLNSTEHTTKEPDVATTYKIYHHHKQPMKISYVSDHIRPPVYNAPPGIFATMDKKPFKPMPPLKYSNLNKPQKTVLLDFRPSPQVLDTQSSELDSSVDNAFRPISMNFDEISDLKDDDIRSKKNNKNTRKPGETKKPAKKHENIKSTRLTTAKPEIITAESLIFENNDDNEMEWANILGAFTKTTPMASHKDPSTKENIEPITSTTPLSTTTTEESTSIEYADSYEEIPSTSTTTSTTSTTTPKPKKRTRPPPKFNKTEKIKKHKRVTSTTTTTTTTTTLKPTRTYPSKRPTDDLTPQASSAATSATNSIWETKTHKAPASTTTTTSSTTPRPTTTIKLTTSTYSTTSPSSTTVDTEQPVVTTQPKSKNRFRQSTLMQKGTSVNHDKWSTSTLDKNRTNTASSHVYPLRRKASKFVGYLPSTTPRSPEVQRDREDHRDHAHNFNKASTSSSTTEKTEQEILVKTTLPTYEKEEVVEQPSEWSHDDDESEQEEDITEADPEHKETTMAVQESKDDHEYIFPTASVIQEVKEYIGLEDQISTTEVTVVASPYSATKNKTKCKKKKHNNLTTSEGVLKSESEPEHTVQPETSSTTSTTARPVTPDIFNELFSGFTMDDTTDTLTVEHSTPAPEQDPSESENHERYLHLDDADDLEDFLHSLDKKSNNHPNDDKQDEEYEDETEGSPYNIREDSKQFADDYYEEIHENQDEPFSLLELMDDME